VCVRFGHVWLSGWLRRRLGRLTRLLRTCRGCDAAHAKNKCGGEKEMRSYVFPYTNSNVKHLLPIDSDPGFSFTTPWSIAAIVTYLSQAAAVSVQHEDNSMKLEDEFDIDTNS
jgi:hypothetical protein